MEGLGCTLEGSVLPVVMLGLAPACGSTIIHSSQVHFQSFSHRNLLLPIGEPTLPDYMRTFNDMNIGGFEYDFTKVRAMSPIVPIIIIFTLDPSMAPSWQCSGLQSLRSGGW